MATTEITRLLEQELARIRAADQRREELLTRLLQEHARQTKLFTERLDNLTQQLKDLDDLLRPGGESETRLSEELNTLRAQFGAPGK